MTPQNFVLWGTVICQFQRVLANSIIGKTPSRTSVLEL